MTAPAAAIAAALRSGALELTPLADGSGVLLHVASLRSCTLNPAGTRLAAALAAGAETAEALADLLVDAYEVDRDTARNDVASLLDAVSRLLAQGGSGSSPPA